MFTFMAGATSTGALVARYSVVRKSSREAVSEVREDVGGGRRDEKQVDALRHGDVLDGALDVRGRVGALGAEHFGDYFFAGERGEGERRNEFLRGAGHHDLHVELFLLQAADELRGLVGSDSARDSESDFHGGLEEAPSAAAGARTSAIHSERYLRRLLSFLRRPAIPATIFEQAELQFLLGDSRGLARSWVVDQRAAADHELAGAARRRRQRMRTGCPALL